MSQENVDLVRGMIEAFLDFDIERSLESVHPEVEWHGTTGGLDEGQVARGHREVIAGFVENYQAWERLILETTRYIDAGDRVVVFWHEIARGRESGVEVETDTAVMYTVEDGRVVRVDPYMERAQALEAAGLESEASD